MTCVCFVFACLFWVVWGCFVLFFGVGLFVVVVLFFWGVLFFLRERVYNFFCCRSNIKVLAYFNIHHLKLNN